jgi:DNA-nicking Smr family endonuclease
MNDKKDNSWLHYIKNVKRLQTKEKSTSFPTKHDAFIEQNPSSISMEKVQDFSDLVQFKQIPTMNSERSLKKFMRRKKIPFHATLDLHGMTQEQAFKALKRFISTCHKQRNRFVLVITGKGKTSPETPQGVLKKCFQEWMVHPTFSKYVISISQALQEHGGAGAFYIHLKKASKI